MAGIYIHIPYCKQACHYCDFHFSTNRKSLTDMVQAIKTEIVLRSEYLQKERIETIYFGGGTPSLLDKDGLFEILESISENFTISENPEITLEANPDDLTKKKTFEIQALGFNRLSLGIQTFNDESLIVMNRAHNAEQALRSLQIIKDAGFNNVSLDLIFGTPPVEGSFDRLENDLYKVINFSPEHVSVYGLTVEPKTAFGIWYEKGQLEIPNEDETSRQFDFLIKTLTDAGYEHYEVSNFSKPGFHSRHNTSYWEGKKYLGIGPGAHSFDGDTRSYNVRNNHTYIRHLKTGRVPEETEHLSETQKLNEYLLTRIRTKRGVNLEFMREKWGIDLVLLHREYIEALIQADRAILGKDHFRLTSIGFQVADEISLRLFSDE